MSKINMDLSFPLDDDGFFRRECPFCYQEFKILLTEDELTNLAQQGVNSYMIDPDDEKIDLNDHGDSESDFFCPYCGQGSDRDKWWTQEQLEYIGVVVNNIMANIINKELIKPLNNMSRKHSSGFLSVQFKGREMEQQEPWISPETNDMDLYELPCCQRKIKIVENWTSKVTCYFCGFIYNSDKE